MSTPHLFESIFYAALDIATPEDRAAYLAEACGNDGSLRARIEQMLAAQAAGFLDGPPDDLRPTAPQSTKEQIGAQIGPYKLLQQIGEGGMGVVFMAEQTRPVERKVALKIIKQGMDTRQVVARFEAERQALAMMDHPNIARVLDAGTTMAGGPYFVMELVRGVPITQYCDEHRLPLRERLELFLPVCHAVQHAHQKGIIHRDLKPSNILVAEYDHVAVAKVIDFGVAKAVSQRLTDRTLFTEFGQVMGTVEYMSPEQAKLNQLDIDTRTDVYSLGVLLYELLTGEIPHDRHRLRAAAFDEVLRIIREDEPARPSTRLSSSHTLPQIAANRRAEPLKLAALLRGELDWIVMKCLEKDRGRRYETANGLARDIERYLHDEPVQACPPSSAYRMRKFARRNKVVLAAAAIVAACLVTASIVSLRQAAVARRAGKLAESRLAAETQARHEATAVTVLFQQALESANPDSAKGADFTVRQLLDGIASKLGGAFDQQPTTEAAIRATIGNAYQRLGELEKAEPQLDAALDLRRRALGQQHAAVAASLVDLARLKSEQGDSAASIVLAKEALAIHRALRLPERETMKVLDELALQLWAVGRWAELNPIVEEIRGIAKKSPDGYPEYANLLHRLAETMVDPKLGEQYARESVALHRKLHGETHPETAWGLQSLAKTLRRQGKFDESERCYREALAIFRRHYDDASGPVTLTLANIATVLRFQHDADGLAELSLEAEQLSAVPSVDYERYVYGGDLHAQLQQWDHAAVSFEKVGELAPSFSAFALARLAWVRLASNDQPGFQRAARELESAIQSSLSSTRMLETARLFVINPRSGVMPEQAIRLAEKVFEHHPSDGDAAATLGAALYRDDRMDQAREMLVKSIELADRSYADAFFFLAMVDCRLGRIDRSREWLKRAAESVEGADASTWPHAISAWIEPIANETLRREVEEMLGQKDPGAKSSPSSSTGVPATNRLWHFGENKSMSAEFEHLQQAADRGELGTVRDLIQSGVDQNTRPGAPYGMSPLMHAAYGGHLEVVRYLVEQGAQLDFVQIERWGTALDFALSADHQDVAAYLKSVGVPLGKDVPNPFRGDKLGGWRDAD